MAEFATGKSKRNKTNEIVHIFLNLLLAIVSVFSAVLSGSPIIGLILVLASKWRVLAVRYRYLMFNLKANLLDFIVGISIVTLTYLLGLNSIVTDIILAVIYSTWLIIIKPISSEVGAIIQTLIATFIGACTISILTSTSNAIAPVILAYFLGYAASRHVYSQSEETDFTIVPQACGLIFSEIAWLCHSWNIIYSYNYFGANIQISQFAIIVTVIAFVYDRIRLSILKYDNNLKISEVALPIIYGLVIIAITVFWFSNPIFNI